MKILYVTIIIVLAVALGFAVVTDKVVVPSLGGGDEVFLSVVSSSSVNVAATSTQLLAANPSRRYVSCANRGPATVWIAMNNTAASKGWGFALWASSSWTMENNKGIWPGKVFALSNGATQKVTCIEAR